MTDHRPLREGQVLAGAPVLPHPAREAPNCGAEIPLMRVFWLCKKANRKRALKQRTVQPTGEPLPLDLAEHQPAC